MESNRIADITYFHIRSQKHFLCLFHANCFYVFAYTTTGFGLKYSAQITGVEIDDICQLIQCNFFIIVICNILFY